MRHFGLRFVASDQKYRFWTGERLDVREFAVRYLRYDWNRPMLLGVVMAEHANSASEAHGIDAALDLLAEGIARSPGSGRAERAASKLHGLLGNHVEEFAAYGRAMRLDPDNQHATGHYAHLLDRHGHRSEAEALPREAVRRWPEVPSFWLRYRARCVATTQPSTAAAVAIMAGVTASPSSHHAHASDSTGCAS